MNIARPPSGFLIVEREGVQETLNAAAAVPWLSRAYSDLKARLKMAGHKVGHPVRGNLSNRIFVEADPVTQVNRMAVAYSVLGDKLVVKSLKVLVT